MTELTLLDRQRELRQAGLALLNILEDSEAEKGWVERGQKALLNILEDVAQERERIDQSRRAMLNLLEDSAEERVRVQHGQKALLNMLDDLDGERATVTAINADLEREIDEHRKAEGALRDRTEELARSNSDLEMFAYAASHDLSEPLRAISGPIALLARRYSGNLDDEADELIAFAVDGCRRMQALIDDLLTYSRVGRFDSQMQSLDCRVVAGEVVASLDAAIASSGVQVDVGSLPTVYANATGLRHVLQNLLSNAIKFSSKSTVPHVRIDCAADGGMWRFTVTDNGIGVSQEHRDRIFGLFKRLHTRDEYPGTGVGLALVKKVVEQHGGDVGVESGHEGVGSTFWFTLPAHGGRPR